MTVMLELPSEMETRLREQAARNGEDMAGYLLALTEEALRARQEEWDDTIAAIQEGLADVEAGRTIALEDFVAQEQAKRNERRVRRTSASASGEAH